MNRFDRRGLIAAWLTPLLMGATPILGKSAILAGVNPYSVAAWRTLLAALLLWTVYLIRFRRYLYIFPAGIVGTFAVGAVNGLGSLLFYNGLQMLDASLVQLLYMLYFVFVMLLTRIMGSRISRMSMLRAGMALVAVTLLTGGMAGEPDWRGAGLIVGAALMYALHVILSQRVMYEMPAPTMTIYAMTSMALVVTIAWIIQGRGLRVVLEPVSGKGWVFILGLTTVTALSRVTLFAGVKHLGGVQAILLNVAELLVALVLAFVLLGERLTLLQWIGAGLLVIGILLSQWDRRQRSRVYRPLPLPRTLSSEPDPAP